MLQSIGYRESALLQQISSSHTSLAITERIGEPTMPVLDERDLRR
jgi:hypothetical protein